MTKISLSTHHLVSRYSQAATEPDLYGNKKEKWKQEIMCARRILFLWLGLPNGAESWEGAALTILQKPSTGSKQGPRKATLKATLLMFFLVGYYLGFWMVLPVTRNNWGLPRLHLEMFRRSGSAENQTQVMYMLDMCCNLCIFCIRSHAWTFLFL